jgi:hypothetical protein
MTGRGGYSEPANDLVAAVRASSFQVYPVGGSPERTVLYGVMDWDGDDVGLYLEAARKTGATMLYLRVVKLDASEYEADEEIRGHDKEIGLVEVSFLKDNLFHRFTWQAEWADGLFDEDDAPAIDEGGEAGQNEEGVASNSLARSSLTTAQDREFATALEARSSELVAGFVGSVFGADSTTPSPDNEWEVRRALLGYLGEKLAIPALQPRHEGTGFLINVDLSPASEKAVKAAVASASREIRTKERAIIEPLVKPCVEWALAEEIPLRSLNFSRLQEFLQARSVSVSSAAVRDLRDKVSVGMKRAKGTASHHAPV